MKTITVSALLLLLTYSHALERGRDYFRDKICQDFNSLGKEKFHAITIVLNSRKYCSGTFEEIMNLGNEIVALAEKCCSEGASAECYTTESSALSKKSCDPNAPFPKHPGTAACCTQEGLARKLCLAALKHPPKEFSTYVQPESEELCEAFKKDPQEFSYRFLYQFSSDHSHTPLPMLLASTTIYLSIVKTCCGQEQPATCFSKERLERKSLWTLTDLSNKACSRYALFEKEKTTLSYLITFTQKIPKASFEDLLALSEDASNVLSKCCDSLEEDCIQREVSLHTAQICSRLSAQDQRVENCCTNKNLTAYLCVYFLPWEKPPEVPDYTSSTSQETLCGEGRQRELDRYMYHFARTFTHSPEAILTLLYDVSQKVMNECCSAANTSVCFSIKRPEATTEIYDLISKGNELCMDYTDHTFLEFKKRLRETYRMNHPAATEDTISAQVEKKASFASTCCHLNAPPSYCGLKVPQETERPSASSDTHKPKFS